MSEYTQPTLRTPRRTVGRTTECKSPSRPQLSLLKKRVAEDRLKWRQQHGQAALLEMFKRMTEEEYNAFLHFGGIPDRLQ